MDVRRPLLLVVALLIAGAVMGRALALPPGAMLAFIAVALLTDAARLIVAARRNRALAMPWGLFAAIALYAAFRVGADHRDVVVSQRFIAQARHDGPAIVRGTVTGAPRYSPNKIYFTLRDVEIEWDGGMIAIPARLQAQGSALWIERRARGPLRPGDRIETEGRLNLPLRLSNPRVWDYGAYLAEQGIAGQLRLEPASPMAVTRASGGLAGAKAAALGASLRASRWVEGAFAELFPERTARIVTALFLGGSHRLSAERDTFLNTGMMHIFAVSGLHTGFVAVLLLVTLLALRVPLRAAIPLLLMGLLCYLALVNFKTAAVRAFIMAAAISLGPWLNRRPDGIGGLSLAAFLILLFDPGTVFMVDFQMSFLSVAAIVTLYPSLRNLTGGFTPGDDDDAALPRRWRRRLQAWVIQPLVLTALIQFTLTPLLAMYYHRVSVVAPLTNLIGAFTVFLIYAGLFIVLAAWAAAPALGQLLATVVGAGVEVFVGGLGWIGDQPWSAITLMPFPWWGYGLFYGLLFGGRYLQWENRPDTRPRQKAAWLLHGAAAVALLVWWPLAQWRGRALEAVFLDVGQGDSTFIAAPDGSTWLIDAGRNYPRDMGREVVGPYLESAGIDAIDVVVATHPDSDHIGGLAWILENFEVGQLLTNGQRRDTTTWMEVEESAHRQKVRLTDVRRGQRLAAPGGMEALVLHPTERWIAGDDTNNASVALWLRYRNMTMALMGDAEIPAEIDIEGAGLAWPAAVLKAGHHGSGGATSEGWLARVRPRVVVLSAGADNSYGHPHPEVIDRAKAAGAHVFRTDEHGAISIMSDGTGLTVKTERKPLN